MKLSIADKAGLALIAFGLPILMGAVTAKAANPPCGPRYKMVEVLLKTYGEKPIGRGVTSKNTMVEIFTSPDGTFSVVITLPSKQSCIVSAGKRWKPVIQGDPV